MYLLTPGSPPAAPLYLSAHSSYPPTVCFLVLTPDLPSLGPLRDTEGPGEEWEVTRFGQAGLGCWEGQT
jgi:hypothetical protein